MRIIRGSSLRGAAVLGLVSSFALQAGAQASSQAQAREQGQAAAQSQAAAPQAAGQAVAGQPTSIAPANPDPLADATPAQLAGIAKDNSRHFGDDPVEGGPLARDLSPKLKAAAVAHRTGAEEFTGMQRLLAGSVHQNVLELMLHRTRIAP